MKAPRYAHFDVFNGDADGLCALQQLRLAQPKASVLITGGKGDHHLLPRVTAQPGDSVTVLDLPVGANRGALLKLLEIGVSVEYFDHHRAPEAPEHPLLRLSLDPAPKMCTSLLVDQHLSGQYRAWAVVGAFGDNLPEAALALARSIGLGREHVHGLRVLGECLNYNAYGGCEAELTIPPARLRKCMEPYSDPLLFMREAGAFSQISRRRAGDMVLAMAVRPVLQTERLTAVLLPDAAWARRVIGSYANHLANQAPGRICAVLVPNGHNGLSVSLRATEQCGASADCLARRHGGDGRATAAGISDLPVEDVMLLLREMQ